MSSFYDDASLVVIPSGYKTSKVYAEKPTDGSGDLAFTRTGDTATRVNSAGLIEKVRTNLLTYSQDASNANWSKTGCTVTADFATAPDGTQTADKLVFGASGNEIVQALSGLTSGAEYTFSFYAKTESGTYDFTFGNLSFALTSGTANTTWQRFVVTQSAGATTRYPKITATSAGTLIVWGFQVEQGVATAYIPTTTAAVSVGPVANVPRLDYLGSTCGKLLLEPQRTNLATYSEQFNNAAWTKYLGATVTANTITSPDGNINADTLTTSAGQEIYANMGAKAASAITYTFSCFAKYNNAAIFQIVASDFSTSGATGIFNLQTGVATFAQGATWANTSVKMENYGNGWYRCILTSTSPNTTGLYTSLFTATAGSVYIYGMQTEEGAYATSYIPTLAASATRGADACSKTGISSLIGQTEGTLYWEGSVNGIPIDQTIFGVEKESSNFVIRFGSDGTNLYAQSYNGSANLFYETTTPSVGQTIKLAFAYKAGSYAFFKNGTLVASGSNASTMPACDKLQTNVLWSGSTGIGAYNTNQALLFKTRLSNAALAELTTL